MATHLPLQPLDVDLSDSEMSDSSSFGSGIVSPTGGFALTTTGQRRASSSSNNDINGQIAAQRQGAENQIMEDIRQLVRASSYDAIRDATTDLGNGTIDFDRFSDKITPILRDHPAIRKTFLALHRPGTDKYAFTHPDEPPTLRPYVKIEDLALDWGTSGDGWSKTCAICIGNFKPPIRTLDCMHSYCKECLLKLVAHEAGMSVREMTDEWTGDSVVDATCPLCKQTTFLCAEADRKETVFNTVMESYLRDTLKYRCPFDCDDVFTRTELDVHMQTCYKRRFICDKGCGEVLRRYELHYRATDCVHFLQDKHRKKDQEMCTLKTELAQLKDQFYAGEREGQAASSSAAGGGGVKRSRTNDA